MIKIGVVGANELSRKHIDKILEMKEFQLVGFYDRDDASAELLSGQFGIDRIHDFKTLLGETDAVDILTPVGTHYNYAAGAIKQLNHVFVDKILSEDLEEARELNHLADEADIQLYVSCYEKFHPNFQLLKKLLNKPYYIESSKFDPNILNLSPESLVFDLVLNELDLVLSVVQSNVLRVRVTGASIHDSNTDFINVRIEFDNGCVYNMIGGSFRSDQKNRIRFYQKNKTYSLNLDNFRISILNSSDGNDEHLKEELLKTPNKNIGDMIRRELEHFAGNIQNEKLKLRTHFDNYQLIHVAHEIIDRLKVTRH